MIYKTKKIIKLASFIFVISYSFLNAKGKYNILFIIADDLRPELGCYGVKSIKTPAIDKLAGNGILFTNAFCNVPVCGGSRASLMSSIRPIAGKRFMSAISRADLEVPQVKTLNTVFKENGYITLSNGKVFHMKEDNAGGWSELPWHDIDYSRLDWAKNAFDQLWLKKESKNFLSFRGRGPYWEAADVKDEEHQDGKVTQKCIQDLERLSKQDKPFFMACGFWRPHLPFCAPKKYFDLYDKENIEKSSDTPIKNLPEECRSAKEFSLYAKVEDYNSTQFRKEAKWAYYACVSFIDRQIEKLVKALKDLKMYDQTVIIITGDHGWHLGEHNFWAKRNNLKNAVRVPLIIRLPHISKNLSLDHLVEFVDLYPTLLNIGGIEIPKHCQGKSFLPFIENPSLKGKEEIFIEWENCYSIKTKQYMYTEFFNDKSEVISKMLFDHESDPFENENIVDLPENKKIVLNLSTRMKKFRLNQNVIEAKQ